MKDHKRQTTDDGGQMTDILAFFHKARLEN